VSRLPPCSAIAVHFFVALLAALPLRAETVATVDGESIDRAEVELTLREAFGKRPIAPEAMPYFQAQTLEQLIDRRVIGAWLTKNGHAASQEEIDARLSDFTDELKRQDRKVEDWLEKAGINEEQLRRRIFWEISWKRYVATTITEAKLQECFEASKKEFDGTEVRVSHLLIKLPEDATDQQRKAARQKAQTLRGEIAGGKTTFAKAVETHSDGTRKNGGDLGFVARHGSMPEPFAAAAFALEKDGLSQPVETSFGVHLILCTQIKPGTKKLADVKREVELLAARLAFEELARSQRASAKVEYSSGFPHFKPGTREVVVP
jgi:parvulin-like peptidyl-prolyl isomerase